MYDDNKVEIQRVANGFIVKVAGLDNHDGKHVFNTLNELIAFQVSIYKSMEEDTDV